MTILTEIWTLICVVVGTILGFGLNWLRGYMLDKQRKRKYLEALFAELEYNKRLVDENKKGGYEDSAYMEAKEAKYLYALPKELRYKIHEAQNMLIGAHIKGGDYVWERIDFGRLKELLENIILEFKNYLRNKK